jgi:hypothetical protein
MNRNDFTDLAAKGVLVFGDLDFRGKCPREGVEQATFFNRLRREYPDSLGLLALHPKNEGQLRGGQFKGLARDKAEGMMPGACDIIIPARIAFACEMKRQDYTQSAWQDGQREYLTAAAGQGAFACVAFGYKAAWQALEYWINHVAE